MRAKTETAEPQAQTGTRLAVGTGRALRDDEIVVAAGERQLGRVIQQIILDRLPRRRRAAGEGHAIAIAFNALVLIAVAVAHRLIRSEEHTSELQSLMRISYAAFRLKKKNENKHNKHKHTHNQT